MPVKKNDLAIKFRRGETLKPLAHSLPELEAWLATPVGETLLVQEQQLIDEALACLFGYRLMQLSISRQVNLFQRSKIRHCFAMGPLAGGNVHAICETQLPLEDESVDVALLHHVLEYSQHPHQLLREAARAVVPSGYMLIVGFNPYSSLGACSLAGRFLGKGIWHNQLFSLRRLVDWLAFMDFSLQSVNYSYYRLPLKGPLGKQWPRLEKKLRQWQLPLGGVYVLLAKKEVSRLTPVQFKRAPVKSAIGVVGASFYTGRPEKEASE